MAQHRIVFLPGDGIGPEVTEASRRVIEAAGLDVEWVEAPMGLGAFETMGDALTESTIKSRIHRTRIKLGRLLKREVSGRPHVSLVGTQP